MVRWLKINIGNRYDVYMHRNKILIKKYKMKNIDAFSCKLTSEESDALLKIQIACLNFLNRKRCLHRENACKLIQYHYRNNLKEQHEKNYS